MEINSTKSVLCFIDIRQSNINNEEQHMKKFLWMIVFIFIVGVCYLAIHFAKDSYKLLPMNEAVELQAETLEQSDYHNWQEFSSPAGDFKVLMPSLPQHISDKSNDSKSNEMRKIDVYMSEKKNGTIFMINLITLLDAKSLVHEELLQNFMKDMLASNPNNTLIASQSTVFKGQKALDFVIENETFNYDVREFFIGNTLVVLSNVSRKPTHNIKDFEFFINSFEFVPLEQKDPKK